MTPKPDQTQLASWIQRLRQAQEKGLDPAATAACADFLQELSQKVLSHAEPSDAQRSALQRAMFSINQLITKEPARGRLIQSVCTNLAQAMGCASVWIALFGPQSTPVLTAQAGLKEPFSSAVKGLSAKNIPFCMHQVLKENRLTLHPLEEVHRALTGTTDAVLERDHLAVCVPLAHNDEAFGVVVTSLEQTVAQDPAQQSLLREVAGDVGFALHKIDTENALRRSEKKYHTYVDHSPLAFFVFDTEGRYVDVNPAGCRMLGYTREELMQCSISDLTAPEEHEKALAFFAQLQQTGRTSNKISLLHKEGRPVAFNLQAVVLEEGRFLALGTDLS